MTLNNEAMPLKNEAMVCEGPEQQKKFYTPNSLFLNCFKEDSSLFFRYS